MIKTVDMEIDKNDRVAMSVVQIHSSWYNSGEIVKKEKKQAFREQHFLLILLCNNYA